MLPATKPKGQVCALIQRNSVRHRLSPHQPEERRPASQGKLATEEDVSAAVKALMSEVLVDR